VSTDKGVARFLERTAGLDLEVREMSETTHTAAEAAAAVGAPVEAIVKSLVFALDGEPLLILVSGPNRVDTALVGEYVNGVLNKADAQMVKEASGYSIGGVPPFGHSTSLRCLMDEDLLALEMVWAAAGSARAVFPISPRRLAELSSAEIVRVC
jgi:prolyl-tRNA editing enzyme YbaK/EbsC (Cys-tRNA(Pro) deacylase)